MCFSRYGRKPNCTSLRDEYVANLVALANGLSYPQGSESDNKGTHDPMKQLELLDHRAANPPISGGNDPNSLEFGQCADDLEHWFRNGNLMNHSFCGFHESTTKSTVLSPMTPPTGSFSELSAPQQNDNSGNSSSVSPLPSPANVFQNYVRDVSSKLLRVVEENSGTISPSLSIGFQEVIRSSLQSMTGTSNSDNSSKKVSSVFGVGGPNYSAPPVLAHPDEFKNSSSFLKIYGDPLCHSTNSSPTVFVDSESSAGGTGDAKTPNGNWTCAKCKNVNFPRRFRCNKCSETRGAEGDRIVGEYAKFVYLQHLKTYRCLLSASADSTTANRGNPQQRKFKQSCSNAARSVPPRQNGQNNNSEPKPLPTGDRSNSGQRTNCRQDHQHHHRRKSPKSKSGSQSMSWSNRNQNSMYQQTTLNQNALQQRNGGMYQNRNNNNNLQQNNIPTKYRVMSSVSDPAILSSYGSGSSGMTPNSSAMECFRSGSECFRSGSGPITPSASPTTSSAMPMTSNSMPVEFFPSNSGVMTPTSSPIKLFRSGSGGIASNSMPIEYYPSGATTPNVTPIEFCTSGSGLLAQNATTTHSMSFDRSRLSSDASSGMKANSANSPDNRQCHEFVLDHRLPSNFGNQQLASSGMSTLAPPQDDVFDQYTPSRSREELSSEGSVDFTLWIEGNNFCQQTDLSENLIHALADVVDVLERNNPMDSD